MLSTFSRQPVEPSFVMNNYILAAYFFFVISCCSGEENYPTVQIPLGKIEGYFTKSVNGRQYAAFEGVPYSRPPIGKYRFREPRQVKPWVGIWQAKTLTKCLQYNHYTEPGYDFVIGEEDCLHLNIYTPKPDITAELDVFIFIHGGAFMFNSGASYGPKIIMDRDVISVNFNYRLGPLGFLSTEDEIVPENNGIKDQIAALKWIKENIKYFGGNPNSITLAGMSAGGASVQIHFLSPLSKGLYHRGISQSGVALNAWVLMEKGREKTIQLAKLTGCPTTNIEDAVECLRYRPARQVVDAVKYFLPWLYNPFSPFGVVADKWSKNPVLPKHPYVLLKNKEVADLPYIFSNVESEGLYPAADFVADEQYLQKIDTQWNELIPFILDYNNTIEPQEINTVSQKIRENYLKDKHVSKETYLEFVKIVSDRLFIADIQKAARLQSQAVKSPVYYYYFAYRGAHSKSELRSHCNENFGASHGDDTIYLLSTSTDSLSTEKDRKMSNILLDLWTSFASESYPKLPNQISWSAISKRESDPLTYIKIVSPNDFQITAEENLGNPQFWDSLLFKENEHLFAVKKDEL